MEPGFVLVMVAACWITNFAFHAMVDRKWREACEHAWGQTVAVAIMAMAFWQREVTAFSVLAFVSALVVANYISQLVTVRAWNEALDRSIYQGIASVIVGVIWGSGIWLGQ